ncbi:hypothetical protein Tco_0445425 [Tanacetum coccineum]
MSLNDSQQSCYKKVYHRICHLSRTMSYLLDIKETNCISRSSTEAEYRHLVDCTCELTWLLCLFKDLKVNIPSPISILCDNESAIALASNPVQHARTKHIELDYHFVREKIKSGHILPSYIPTRYQAADVLTKGGKSFKSSWGSPIPIGDGDGDVKRFLDEDGGRDGE